MKANRIGPYTSTLFLTTLVAAFSFCNNESKTNDSDQFITTPTESSDTRIDNSSLLKYTTGIRSILKDSKGNIWFGSHMEGVCLFNG